MTFERPLSTYSIVARDAHGTLGVAVQSHWFNVGAVVPFVERNVGAVAVQSISDPASGTAILGHLRTGVPADAALQAVLGDSDDGDYRQLAVVDAVGSASAHTGERCIAEAGHAVGRAASAQANIMGKPTVWGAMLAAFEAADGDLAARLLVALEAGQAEGGDLRGSQSAALVAASPTGEAEDFDLRVEDDPEPLLELARLIDVRRAYVELNRGDALMAAGDYAEALTTYEHATTMLPDEATDGEAAFWTGVAFVAANREADAAPFLRRGAALNPAWAELLPRLVRSAMLPDDDRLVERLRSVMQGDEEI